MSEKIGELMEQAWSSMEELCSQLDPREWELPTDCPGWTVKDQFAHICALEALALGRPPAPAGDAEQPSYVKNEIGALNERELDARRSRSPEELLEEYRDVTGERGKVLASWSPSEWESEGKGVLGTAPRKQIISIRVLDVFIHEQDIRVATGKPGHMSGEVARHAYGSMAGAIGFVLAKKAQASEGQSVVFSVGPPGDTFAYGMSGGRGVRLDPPPDDPTVRISVDCEAFLRLTTGRWTPERTEEEGRLRIAGDRDLAGRILNGMNVML